MRQKIALLYAAFIALVFFGCDSFSIPDAFALPGEAEALALTADETTSQLNGTVSLTVTGGEEPYEFSVAAEDLYEGTAENPIGSVYNQSFAAGTAIGRIRITVTDAAGSSADAFVTVVPPTPTLSLYAWVPKTGVNISIAYSDANRAMIDGFLLTRSKDGEEFTAFSEPEKTTESTSDNYGAETSSVYAYRLYAVSGSYQSVPDEQEI